MEMAEDIFLHPVHVSLPQLGMSNVFADSSSSFGKAMLQQVQRTYNTIECNMLISAMVLINKKFGQIYARVIY